MTYGVSFETLRPRAFGYVLTHGEEALPFHEYMLDNGVDINELNPKGTALHIAVTVDDPVLMRWLLDHVADPRFGPFGLTAADWAEGIGETETRLLQNHKRQE